MRATLSLLFSVSLWVGCANLAPPGNPVSVRLGDDDTAVRSKMLASGARDVTADTKYEFYGAYQAKQKYYWWELKDRTVVAILLVGETESALKVITIEIGEPGKGIAGIATWRSQKLTEINQ